MENNASAFISGFNELVRQKHSYDSKADACFEIEVTFPPRGKYASMHVRFVKVPLWRHAAYPGTVDGSVPHSCMVDYGRAWYDKGWLYAGTEISPVPPRIKVLGGVGDWFPGHPHNLIVTAEYNVKHRAFELQVETSPCYPIMQCARPALFGKAEFVRLHRHLSALEWLSVDESNTLDICGSGNRRGMRMMCTNAGAYNAFKKAARAATSPTALAAAAAAIQSIEWQNNERGPIPNAQWLGQFRLKTKTEVQQLDISEGQTAEFFRNYKRHTYRLKKRYMFRDALFELSLTMVKEATYSSMTNPSNHPKSPHPSLSMYGILVGLLGCDEKYELEIEYKGNVKQPTHTCAGTQLCGWIDKCYAAISSDCYGSMCGDETHMREIVRAYNSAIYQGEQPDRVPDQFLIRSEHVPSVVSLTPARLQKLKTDQYTLLSKTDGERSVGLAYGSMLYLFPCNARMLEFQMPSFPADDRIVLDGELYESDSGDLYYYIFDVYASNGVPDVVSRPLQFRLDSVRHLDSESTGATTKLTVRTKRLSSLEKGIDMGEVGGMAPRTDGLIVMYAGPLTFAPLADTKRQQSLVAMKWKPAAECTVDFQLSYERCGKRCGTRRSGDGTLCVKVGLLSLFTSQSHLSMYELCRNDASYELPTVRSLVPFIPQDTAHAGPPPAGEGHAHHAHAFLPCDDAGVVLAGTTRIYPGDIAEMGYSTETGWHVLRKRDDKTTPNAISVAVDNWELAHSPSFSPPESPCATLLRRYENGSGGWDGPSVERAPYYRVGESRKYCGTTAHHNTIKRASVLWAASTQLRMGDDGRRLAVMELGCGRGTELVTCFLPQLGHRLELYVGVDVDEDGLLRAHDGAYWRYYSALKKSGLDASTQAPRVRFLQGDCTRAISTSAPDLSEWTDVRKQKAAYATLGRCDEQFDLISVQFALHYMYKSADFWSNIYRMLRPGGILVATVPNGDFIRSRIDSSESSTYSVNTHDDFEFVYVGIEGDSDRVLFSSTKIHAQPEPLFFCSVCEAMVAQQEGLECNISLFSDTAACPFALPKREGDEQSTDAEAEYSKDGHCIVIIRKGPSSGYSPTK